jgi:regulator of protease activity HflC (stomatin/prohibitin superfamily)
LNKSLLALIVGVPIVFIAIFLLLGSIAIIGPGERGVLLHWSAVDLNNVLGEGLHFIMPIQDSVDIMDVKTNKIQTDASAASSDMQTVSAKIAVNFHVEADRAAWLRQNISKDYQVKVIDPAIQESVKAATAQFSAVELITKRPDVRETMKNNMKDKMFNLTMGSVVIDEFNIVDFDFSSSFNAAIEAKVTAEQNALTAKNKLEQIKYEADQQIATAQGNANATLTNAYAAANSLRIQSEAISKNRDILELEWIKKWDGKLPVWVMGEAASNLMVNVPSVPS